jgi:hypothetical protein
MYVFVILINSLQNFVQRIHYCQEEMEIILNTFCSVKILYFAFRFFTLFLLKCTYSIHLFINFYLFFRQNTCGKELAIDKGNISKDN